MVRSNQMLENSTINGLQFKSSFQLVPRIILLVTNINRSRRFIYVCVHFLFFLFMCRRISSERCSSFYRRSLQLCHLYNRGTVCAFSLLVTSEVIVNEAVLVMLFLLLGCVFSSSTFESVLAKMVE